MSRRAPQPEAQRRRRPSQIRRVIIATAITIAMSFAALIHFRIGVPHLYPMAQGNSNGLAKGPFSGVAASAEFVVPIAIAGIVFVSWYWVVVGPIQQSRTVRRGR